MTYCHTCKREFHSLGIMRHRAMHRDKKQDCKITYTHGDTWEYTYNTTIPILSGINFPRREKYET